MDTSPLLDMCFANISSKFVAHLFMPLTISSEEQKFLILMKANLSFFILWVIFFISYLRKFCLIQVIKIFSLFPFRGFIVLTFTCKYTTHFELIFIYDERLGLMFILCIWISNCSGTICSKNCLFSFQQPLHLCQQAIETHQIVTKHLVTIPTRAAKIKMIITSVDKNVEKLGPSYIDGKNVKWSNYFGKQFGSFSKC